ncbi:MAG: Exodeoxyribonuclease [Firmicutes bacterium]|nr:Exodeoxyribonuclease [candidate division NPL-UPA2 bacterium]
MPIKLISWNVNGIRACVGKGFLEYATAMDADFFCLQETKLQAGQIELEMPGYLQFWNYAQKKGYSGTAIFTKHAPQSVRYGLGLAEHDTEGRVVTLEYNDLWLVNVYTPNSQPELARLGYRMEWDDAFFNYLQGLNSHKPVVLCGDLNVAHQEIDLKNPASNRRNAGFTDEERAKLSRLLDAGYTDTYRHFYPDQTDAYTWWSYMMKARERNIGWRIDYFVVADALVNRMAGAEIHPHVHGSDHCPVVLILRP